MNREKINIDFNLNKISTKNFKPKNLENESSSSEEESDNEKDYRNKVNNELFSLEEKKKDNEKINEEIFNYDEIYDKIQSEKKIKKNSSQIKYMTKILEKAELRKIERNKNLIKVEKEQYKKETGKNLDDLPSFITKSYQKKLDKVNTILNYKDNNNSFFKKNDDINEKVFENRKKEYQKNLIKFDDEQIKKIVNRERIINNYHKEKNISQNTNLNENLSKEDKIKAYKERYLQRKREKTD
jgi:hypothetical protein